MVENISIIGKIHNPTITEPQTHKSKTNTTSLRASQAYLNMATNMKKPGIQISKIRMKMRSFKEKKSWTLDDNDN